MRDHFFDAKRCDRCGADLSGGRIMSMFNTQVICMACAEKALPLPPVPDAA